MTPPTQCVYCDNPKIVKNGKKRNGTQNYKCIDCNRQFVETYGTPYYRKQSDAIMTLYISALLNLRGFLDFRLVAQFIELLCGVTHPHTTYYYRHLGLDFSKLPKPEFGKIWHIDELFDKVKGSKDNFGYLFAVCDEHSNLICLYQANERSTRAAKNALRKARTVAGFAPDVIVHDGCPIYERAVRIFGRKTKHCQAHFKAEPFAWIKKGALQLLYLSNNRVERINAWLRRWLKHMKGFKAFDKANIWADMITVLFNLRHMPLSQIAIALFF